MTYIVMKSSDYYPDSGTSDWVLVTEDLVEAEELYDEIAKGGVAGMLSLVRVDGEEYGTVQSTWVP